MNQSMFIAYLINISFFVENVFICRSFISAFIAFFRYYIVIKKMLKLRNRSALAVNCCVIIHCLEVSCKEDQITRAARS